MMPEAESETQKLGKKSLRLEKPFYLSLFASVNLEILFFREAKVPKNI